MAPAPSWPAFGPGSDGELAYAGRLLSVLDRTMLLLADAGFDANEFARDVQATGAQFLVRSSARRVPTPFRHLGDGSCLARIGYGVLPVLQTVRVIEASVTATLADGTVRTEQWRLLTSLLDPAAHPAAGLVDLYHERWQSETTYFSIKATTLDGHVLRSRSLTGLDQEVHALLTTYHALIRTAADTARTRPGLDMDRISFSVLQTTPADTVTTAPPRPESCPRPDPPTSPAPSAGPPPTLCTPPTTGTASRPPPARTPPASTDRTPDNTPRPVATGSVKGRHSRLPVTSPEGRRAGVNASSSSRAPHVKDRADGVTHPCCGSRRSRCRVPASVAAVHGGDGGHVHAGYAGEARARWR
ncbi:transposase [Streptomyces scopuliridis]|uniref:transposase n=1 Tax=Streptomyces scopuliridis TaxID=452529 RepID=UPI002DD91169|nr:transposase [Streptomyces scopuliridis]WSB33317.1 transposase [Streptomyces scopuliridis]